MRVLVVNPWITDFKLYDEWMHPLGLYFLISLLLRRGCEVDYLNCLQRPDESPGKRFSTGDFPSEAIPKPAVYQSIPRKFKRYGISTATLREKLAAMRRPDAVCTGSSMTYWLAGVVQTISAIREIWPDVPVVAGGIAATLFPGFLREQSPDAHLFTGALTGARMRCGHPAIDNLTAEGPDPSLVEGLSLVTHHHHGPVLSSLGCPMSCAYCASRLLHPCYEQRPVETVLAEVRFMSDRRGVRDFAFYDDALLHGNGVHLLALLNAAAEAGLTGMRLHTPNGMHLQWVNDRTLEAMKTAGFVTMRFGYESGHANQAAATSGKSDRKLTEEKLALVRKHGFDPRHTGVYVMAGLDGQTPQDVIDDLTFMHSLGVQAKPVFISPVPGTSLFERYAARFPLLKVDPLWHNDMFFVTQLDGWNWETTEEIRALGKKLNAEIG